MTHATLNFYPRKDPRMRFFALWYFTILLIAWTILGDTVLGFEQSYAQPIIGVLTACAVAFFLEWLDARMNQRCPIRRQHRECCEFFAALHHSRTGLRHADLCKLAACAYRVCSRTLVGFQGAFPRAYRQRPDAAHFQPFKLWHHHDAFAASCRRSGATVSVHGERYRVGALADSSRDPDYGNDYSRKIYRKAASGSGLVLRFAAQALIRKLFFGMPLAVPFLPMTSAGFILFSLYMIPDPATTPIKPARQMAFGFSVATIYALATRCSCGIWALHRAGAYQCHQRVEFACLCAAQT